MILQLTGNETQQELISSMKVILTLLNKDNITQVMNGANITAANGLTKDQVKKLLAPMEHTIATMDAYQKHLAQAITQSNHNVDTDINLLWQNLQAVKKDLATMKTHFGNNADIVDTIMNRLIVVENNMKLMKPKLVKHIETGTLLTVPVNQTLRTMTKWGNYEYEYMKDGKVIETDTSNLDLTIAEDVGNVGLTPLQPKITTFSIFSL